jgi:hypothetical protein
VTAWLHIGLRVERGNQVVHGPESEVRQLSLLTRPSGGNRWRVLFVAEWSFKSGGKPLERRLISGSRTRKLGLPAPERSRLLLLDGQA